MSTPQTVPSKAILRVLQGLLLGTSCSLAVLIEDRRRRINTVQSILENGRKLKALPSYREGGTERAIARALATCNIDQETASGLREGLVPDSSLFSKDASTRSYAEDTSVGADLSSPSGTAETTGFPVPVYRYDRMAFAKYFPGMDRLAERHRRAPLSRAIRGATDRPGKYELASREIIQVIATVTGLLTSDEREWRQGWKIALQALSKPTTRPILETALLENVIQLARALEQSGRVFEAGQLLRLVVASDAPPISPADSSYVERVLIHQITSLCSTAAGQKTRKGAIDRAVHIYVAAFHHHAPADSEAALTLGMNLVPNVVELGLYELAGKLVTACGTTGFRAWNLQNHYLSCLFERGAYLDGVDHFIKHYSHYPSCLAHRQQLESIVDAIVQLHGLRSGAVIEFLDGVPWIRELKGSWIAKLIEFHWKFTANYKKTKAYFKRLVSYCDDPQALVPSRAMIQIAFAAGEAGDAQQLLSEYQQGSKEALDRVPLLGTLALARARDGHWQEVQEIFSEMASEARNSQEARSRLSSLVARALPPVIKEYGKTHSLHATAEYVKYFVGELEIEVDKYLVTLLAKRYAIQYDVRGLVEWLAFCACRGFANDSAFLTAILSSCREWGYGYNKILSLARKFHKINPRFDRSAYIDIIRDAAARTKSTSMQSVRHAIEPVDMGNERAICRAMVAAIRRGAPQTAIEIYNDIKSVEEVDQSGKCLREAIRASILQENGDSDGALAILREAQERGQNIGPALTPILAAHLDNLPPLVDPVEEFLQIQKNLKAGSGVDLPSSAFTSGSYRFLKVGRFADAINFCQVAMDMDGSPGVATNQHHFAILMEGYARSGRASELRNLFVSTEDKPFVIASSCLRSLRRVHFKLHAAASGNSVDANTQKEVISLISRMIRLVRTERARVSSQASTVAEKAMRIMNEAAQTFQIRPPALVETQRPHTEVISPPASPEPRYVVPSEPEIQEESQQVEEESTTFGIGEHASASFSAEETETQLPVEEGDNVSGRAQVHDEDFALPSHSDIESSSSTVYSREAHTQQPMGKKHHHSRSRTLNARLAVLHPTPHDLSTMQHQSIGTQTGLKHAVAAGHGV